jgi:cytochrome c oxidase subunit 2
MKKLSLIALATAMCLSGGIAAASRYGLQDPQTSIARDIYSLHTLILWICVVIFVAVFGAMFYSIFKHRKSVGHKAAHFHENTTVEVIWTVIPFVILLGMAYPATKTIIEMKDTSNPDLTIKVTGYQWKWGYEYIKGEGSLAGVSDGVNFYSNLSTPQEQIYDPKVPKGENYLLEVDNELVVPVGKKVRILTTAADVIHAFWVPAFGVKQDAIPGFIRDTWFKVDQPGVYRGQCAELCGKEHGFMPIVVRAVSEEEFKEWAIEAEAGRCCRGSGRRRNAGCGRRAGCRSARRRCRSGRWQEDLRRPVRCLPRRRHRRCAEGRRQGGVDRADRAGRRDPRQARHRRHSCHARQGRQSGAVGCRSQGGSGTHGGSVQVRQTRVIRQDGHI